MYPAISSKRTFRLLAACAAALIGTVAVNATTAHATAAAANCVARNGHTRAGHFSGIVLAVSPRKGCAGQSRYSDPAIGQPPLIFHGGPVMGTASTGALVLTPIFWNPAGHQMDASYKNILATYIRDVAKDSGKSTNVYSTLNEYYGNNGQNRYKVTAGTPINDTNPLPADGCQLLGVDKKNIYADNTGYDSCLDDNQLVSEIDSILASRGLPRDYAHNYVLFLPKHVESCFYAGSTATAANACTINHEPSGAYCAYHNQAPSGTVYSNMPFPIYFSQVGYTCGSNAHGHGIIESPNGNPDADTEVSPTSHEVMEAATDPDTTTGWYDQAGYENGDECAYVYGTMLGTAGQRYNQVINRHEYLTQEEFSNKDFAVTNNGCLQHA